mmetsp:Transcript_38671/g.95657  ORF Transcript_38671/g.95657 Transcript_38671/m.95657 type:complete len:363 (-) Transcript_38671:104-1192(-)
MINHFRNHYELTRKDLLIKNLKRMQRSLIRDERTAEADMFDFFPLTFVLPADYGLFVEEFKQQQGAIWIMKPIGKAQGKGIFLFNKLSQISNWKKDSKWRPNTDRALEGEPQTPQAEAYVVQKYLEDPLLIGGKKFDMRIYVLVTNYQPLTVYLYRSGFARFSSSRYLINKNTLADTYIHLTNAAIQKTAPGYEKDLGCKWPLHSLKLHMISLYGMDETEEVFLGIQNMIINSLLAVQKVIINDKHCFEVYGYDVMVDDALKPWLIEVNASPSISADTQADYELKYGLLDDVYTVLDPEGLLEDEIYEQVGGFDLIYHNGPVRPEKGSKQVSRLGCFDDRARNLKRLFKQHSKAAAGASANK